jgi:hypothetical protein
VRESGEAGAAREASTFPWRFAIGAAAMGLSLCLAAVVWAGRGTADEARPDGDGEHHQLTAEQAACLRFGLVTSRSDTRHLSLLLGSYSTLDPTAENLLHAEVRDLDEIGGDFPDADFRLINSVSDAADADAVVLARGGTIVYRSAVNRRAQSLTEAEAACRDLADFDTTSLRVVGSDADGGRG